MRRVWLEHAPDQLGDYGPCGLQQRTSQLGSPVSLDPKRIPERLAGERTRAPNPRVHRGRERVDVGATVGRKALDLLGCRKPRGAQDRDRVLGVTAVVVHLLGRQRVSQHPGKTEVDELGLGRRVGVVGLADEHVRRLDVAVDQSQRVDVVQRPRQLDENLSDDLTRGLFEKGRKFDPSHELLGKEEALAVCTAAEVVDPREVWMMQLREQPELVLEGLRKTVGAPGAWGAEAPGHVAASHRPRLRPRPIGHRERREVRVATDDLQRDDAVFELVVRLIDRTKPAAPQKALHRIPTRDAVRHLVGAPIRGSARFGRC